MIIKTDYGKVVGFKAARTVMGKPLYVTNFFYFDGMLIDTGPAHVSSEILAALREFHVEKAVVTHHHEDHAGNCRLLQKELDIPIYAHPDAVPILANPYEIEIYRKIMWGNLPRVSAIPLGDTINTNSCQMHVLHTGGHSPDHVCFYEPQNKWLFTGDLYLGENLTIFMIGENIVEHLNGLQRLISLKPKIIFCGLKGRVDDATTRLVRKYESLWKLGLRVKQLYEENANRKQILSEVLGGEIFFYYFSQNNWGRRFLLDTIIENLDFFQDDKKNNPLRDRISIE